MTVHSIILISHNKFYSPSWNEPYAAIFSWLVSGAVVTNNIFTGAGECAIYVNPFGGYFGDWRLIGNNFQNFDATLAPIFLGSGTTNCLVVGGPRDTVIDNGVDNIIVGANNMGYHELGQDIKDAMQHKKERQ